MTATKHPGELLKAQRLATGTVEQRPHPQRNWGLPVATFWVKQRAHQRMRPQLVTLGLTEVGRPLFAAIPQQGTGSAEYPKLVSGVLAATHPRALSLVMPDIELMTFNEAGYAEFINKARVASRVLTDLPWLTLEDIALFSDMTFAEYAVSETADAKVQCTTLQFSGNTRQLKSGWQDGRSRQQVCPEAIEMELLRVFGHRAINGR